MTMGHLVIISIFLLPLVTASGDEFWDDVDMIDHDLSDPEEIATQWEYNNLSDREDLPIQATGESTPQTSQHSSSSLKKRGKKTSQRRVPMTGKFFQKFVTIRSSDIEKFKQKSITADSQNLSHTIIKEKLEALEDVNRWFDIYTYEVDKYAKYWVKVCVTFWDKPLVKGHRIGCIISRSYSNYTRRMLITGQRKQYFDLLSCKCHTYINNCRMPLSTPELFLIHKDNNNEFFIFEENELEGKLAIKGFKDGITLPDPSNVELSKKSSAKFKARSVTLLPHEINDFNRAIIINTSYPKNVSLEDINKKLMELKEISEWPDLLKYDIDQYSKYWAKVCVFFWDKRLNGLQRQACIVSPSLGDSKIRKLFIEDTVKHFDILWCKCHSYIKNYRIAASNVDTFLIHRSNGNEFFVLEQRRTQFCKHALFTKHFKGGITLPNPEHFN